MSRPAATLVKAACTALALLSAGCGDAPDDPAALREGPGREAFGPGPSLLLVTIDTLRADHVGAYGDADAETPALDGLARRGLLFERAWTAVPITLPSHATLLSGLYPHEHGARDNGLYCVPDAVRLLPEALSERGWRTGAFVGSVVLAARYGLDQGFDAYDVPQPGAGGDAEGGVERRAGAVVDAALAWLDTLPADERFLLWVHLYDPHARYEPPEPWASRHAESYDGEIAYADSQLLRLLAALAERGRDDRLAVIATADHGESLGEHGEPTHGVFIHDATMRVPLIVVAPGGLVAEPAGGRRSAAPVSLADVPATALDLLGLPRDILPAARTPSLLASAADATAATDARPDAPPGGSGAAGGGDPDVPGPGRALYLESLLPLHQHRWQPLRGVVWDGWKLIDTSPPELYALDDDPRETVERTEAEPARLAAAREHLAALLARHRTVALEAQAPTEAERGQLEALGYVGSAVEGDPFDAALPLPRERAGQIEVKVAAARVLREGLEAFGAGAPGAQAMLDDARARLAALLAIDPSDPTATQLLGMLEMALGRHAEAIPPLEANAIAVPRSARTRFSLAQCYAATGRADWAVAEMQKAVTLDPTWPTPYRWLAEHHVRAGEPGRALWWLEELSRRRHTGAGTARARDEGLERLADSLRAQRVTSQPPDSFPATDFLPEGRRGGG